jgi:hypothetical protein
MLRRAGREMERRPTKFKVRNCLYDKQCTGEKREVTVALRDTKKGDEHSNSRYCSCRMEHQNLLEKMRQAWQKINWNK